ncbi:MAG: ABC-2 type transport system permease protein [Verrucomicrobiales bacterium]|jgi:ABC-2 type transport system permease protein
MIWTIARREVVTRARTKPFQILTAIMFIGVLLAAVLISVLTGAEDGAQGVIIGLEGDGATYADALSVATEDIDPLVVMTTNGPAQIDDGTIDVLFDGTTLTWKNFARNDLDTFVRSSVQQVEFANRATELDLSAVELTGLFNEVEIDETLLDGDRGEQGVRIIAALVSTIGTFMMLQLWGAFLMMGVIEEKSSRVVEVLLSHVSPRTLLTGKILGLGILALAQLLIVVFGLGLGLAMVQDIEIPDGVWSSIPLLLVTFLLGYAFYASLFAAVGSTVSRQEDAQTAQLPAMLPLLLGYGIAMTSISNPDSTLVAFASYVPFTSPVVLPFRVAMANPPWWEIALALAVLAISVPLMLRVAGAIYRTSLLQVGTRIPLMEAFRNRSAES